MLFNNEGWICPNCSKGVAPWMPFCCKPQVMVTSTVNPFSPPETLSVCPHLVPVKFGCKKCDEEKEKSSNDTVI